MKRFLFVLCVLGLLLAGYACAEPNSYKFPEELCTVEGISFRITYSKTDHEWQASITDADPGCVSTAVPFEVGCTADWVEYNDGTEEAPVYRTVNNVYVTATVRSIDSKAFQGCTSLTKIAIPDTVKTIGMNAFDGCTSLKSVNFGAGLNTIEAGAFSGCPLTEIVVPDSVTSIGGGAFGGTTPVNVTLPFTGVSLTNPYIYNKEFKYIFSGENSQRGDIPDTIRTVTITQQTEYTDRVFADCSRITTIHIPDGTTGIAAEAFDGCTSLTDFQLPSALESIGGYAFQNCALAFKGKLDLSNVKGSIGIGAFKGCTGITGVSFGTELTSISSAAFSGCPLTEIVVPDSVTSIGEKAFEGSKPVHVTLPFTGLSPNGSTDFCSFKYIFSGLSSEAGDVPETIRSVTITKQTEAKAYAFRNCAQITTIRYPDETTSIRTYAFDGCAALTDFQLPAALESIENYAFNGCAALGSVRYGGSPCMRELVSIGDRNESLTNAAWTYALTKELILPQNVQLLESEALAGTGAEVVLIPQSCSSVAADAFDNCPGLRYIVNRSAVEINAPDGVTVLN